MKLEQWAASYAQRHLESMGDRWLHTQGVARQARRTVAAIPPQDGPVLIAAAYLHDLGYAQSIAETEFHPLDGARHLRSLGYERLAGLVAHHSAARIEAAHRGLAGELAGFDDERSLTSMALAYCDMTTGPAGERVSLDERITDVMRRYGPDHVVSRSLTEARPALERCVQVIQAKLYGATFTQ